MELNESATLNGGFIAEYIPWLHYYDASLKHKCYVWIGSLLVDVALLILVYLYSKRLKTFNTLPNKHKFFWCLTGVRAIFGIHTVIYCGITCLKDRELYEDKVFGRTLASDFFMARIVGFFVFECISLFMSDIIFKTFNKGLAIHHTLSLLGYSVGSFINQGHYFGTVGILMEISTPATSVCWMLIQAKLSKHIYWKMNQHFLIYLFHTRQNLGFYAIYILGTEWEYINESMNIYFKYLILANSIVVTLFLNPYWTYKKTIQLSSGEDWNFSPKPKPKASAFPIIAPGKEESIENLEAKNGNTLHAGKIPNGIHKNGKIKCETDLSNGMQNGANFRNRKKGLKT